MLIVALLHISWQYDKTVNVKVSWKICKMYDANARKFIGLLFTFKEKERKL